MHGYFHLHMIDVRSCSGSPSNESSFQDPHWQIVRKPRAIFHLQLRRSAAEQFDGDDAQGHDNNGSSSWHFPQTIRPLDGKAEERQGVVYDIVGRAFFCPGSSHFIARYATPDKRIYDYDGMKLGGYATVDRKAKINTHIAGTHRLISPPPRYNTCAVIYHLRGGTEAQRYFSRHQMALAQQVCNIEFIASHIGSQLTDSDLSIPREIRLCGDVLPLQSDVNRFWAQDLTNSIKHVEYVSRMESSPSPPPKCKKAKLHVLGSDDEEIHIHDVLPSTQQPRPPKHKRVKMRVPDSDDETHVPSTQQPLPPPPLTPEYEFYCWCGSREHGDLQKESEVAIQCDNCERWSHIACQRDGQASNLAKKEPFYCDTPDCAPYSDRALLTQIRRPEHSYGEMFVHEFTHYVQAREGSISTSWQILVSRQNQVMLTVWWKGIVYSEVAKEDLVDALYGDHKHRRMIRLGRWTHAHEVPQHEDVITNFRNIPYSVNINEALAPHGPLLTDIFEQPDPAKMRNTVPVLGYLADLSEKTGRKHTTVPYCGDLSLTDCTQIANWIYHHICGASNQIINWLNCATYAHTCTIVVAKHKKNRLQELAQNILTERHSSAPDMNSVPTPEEQANAMLQAAWLDLQLSYDQSAMDIQ
ncbi:hypothetical protein BDR05DRAFT_1015949 [Suillus weaverae]|nr:hypothetical protein BDR05DRAFT_1015949 [Suillus weaverae]